jgi:hypothetical protein
MILMALILVLSLISFVIVDFTIEDPFFGRGVLTKLAISQFLRLPKRILRLPKQYKELTELARTQEDKEIEVIIQELDKELAERNS